MIGIMEKGKKIPPQEASQTNPVAKPEDTKGGITSPLSLLLSHAQKAKTTNSSKTDFFTKYFISKFVY
jgi:hypothetical protein